MLARLDRLSLSHDELDRPIPTLSERQFVVAKVKRTKEEERLERELFWYREELFSRIELSWNEVSRLGEAGSIRNRADCRPSRSNRLEVFEQDQSPCDICLFTSRSFRYYGSTRCLSICSSPRIPLPCLERSNSKGEDNDSCTKRNLTNSSMSVRE